MEIEHCLVCNANLSKQTTMERHIHINRCLDGSSAQEAGHTCPVCSLSLATFTVEERNQHVLECVEGCEAADDFEGGRDGAVLKAFESAVAESVDIESRDFRCWMCAKPLHRLSIKTRLLHLSDCTRIPKDALEAMFLVQGDTEDSDEQYRIKSRGLTPEEIMRKLQSLAKSVDRQLLSLNVYRQNLQIQIDRASTLLPNRNRSHNEATRSRAKSPISSSTVKKVATVSKNDAKLPSMKPSALGSGKPMLRHDAGPESFPDDADVRSLMELAHSQPYEHREDNSNSDQDEDTVSGFLTQSLY